MEQIQAGFVQKRLAEVTSDEVTGLLICEAANKPQARASAATEDERMMMDGERNI